jgi:hypothetical protein
MERSEIREAAIAEMQSPDCASLHPSYRKTKINLLI